MPRTPLPIDRPIALVGMMGAGKTSVGKVLAERLGLQFVDADSEIEREAGVTIPAIFARFGEARFREMERQAVARLVEGPPRVIALGGGAFADMGARALVLERCIAVWLEADVGTLAARVRQDEQRPLLQGRDAAHVVATLSEQRGSAYSTAHLRVCSAGRSPSETADAVMEALLERAR